MTQHHQFDDVEIASTAPKLDFTYDIKSYINPNRLARAVDEFGNPFVCMRRQSECFAARAKHRLCL